MNITIAPTSMGLATISGQNDVILPSPLMSMEIMRGVVLLPLPHLAATTSVPDAFPGLCMGYPQVSLVFQS